jgi:hypothetical protein
VCGSSLRHYSNLRQHNKPKTLPRTSARSTGGLERHPPTARIRLLLSCRDTRTESQPWRLRSRVNSGPTTTSGTPSKLAGELRASTTTTTTTRATMTTVGAGGATTATTTASVAGHRTSGVRRPSAGASVM